ncbi:MAG TPA: choice-of-anchor V domain-containing protein [Bryobacteraceae bacterium]|nr:choice-of-anchor V domain-containing protein [Bryobacteraceae bacterium]
MKTPARFFLCVAFPLYVYAHSTGLPIDSTSTLIDGGNTCAQCHTGGTNGPGHVTLGVAAYTPGIAQTIQVTIAGETAQEFGFQLTARLVNDPTQKTEAGYFLPSQSTPESQAYCSPDSTLAPPALDPCASNLEFATHTENSISPTGVGTRTWRVVWVPPGRDLGDVHFYVAVVAGSKSGPTGDRVYLWDIVVSRVDCNLAATPQINTGASGVEDAASFRGSIASNGLISIFGQGFSILGGPIPNTPATGNGYFYTKADLAGGNWPTQLACVQVTVDGTPVPVYFVNDKQINAQAPIFPPLGESASVVVIVNPGTNKQVVSNAFLVNGYAIQPSLFVFGGSNNAAALNASKGYAYLADTSVVPSGVSAAPGDIIEIFGTGFGPTKPSYQPGQFASPPPAPLPELTTTPFSVTVGGVPASKIPYKGLAFDAPGFYQVNVVVPNVPDGDQEIIVNVGGATSQRGVMIPVKH